MGSIPENEAADFARKTGNDVLECEIRAQEELQRLQEALQTPVRYSPEVEEFMSNMSEEQRNLLRSANDTVRRLPIAALENLIEELKRLREMAWCLTAHIQDYAETSEYCERRRAFLLTGETPPEPVADTQTLEQKEADCLTDEECIKKLVDTGFIAQNTNIKTKTVYAKTRAVTAPKIYKKLLELTNGDGNRAERIMRNNISGVESGLKQYLSRNKK
jgi:hypothetical protein